MLPRLRDLLKPKAKSGTSSEKPSDRASSPLTEAPVIASAGPTASAPSAEKLFEQAQGVHQQGRLEEAIELYGLVIEGTPGRAQAYYKRANALNGLGRLEAALQDYDRAIDLDPSYVYALCNRGSVLERLERREEALASYDRALALDPKDALTHYNRGSVLKDLKRFEEALASYDAAIALNGDFAEAYVNRGNVLQALRRHAAAVESFGRAIELNPSITEAFQGRGVSLYALKRFGEAHRDYEKARVLDPTGKYLLGMRLDAQLRGCDWDGLGANLDLVAEDISAGKPVCAPAAYRGNVATARPCSGRWRRFGCGTESWAGWTKRDISGRSSAYRLGMPWEFPQAGSGSDIFPLTFAAIPWPV